MDPVWIKIAGGGDAALRIVEELAARLNDKPASERRVAVVPSEGGGDRADGGAADPDLEPLLQALREAGYRTGTSADEPSETLSFATYSAFLAGLGPGVQRRIVERWGAAEQDPLFRPGRLDCGHFVIRARRFGRIALLQAPRVIAGEAEPVPPHSAIAAFLWLTDDFRADAVVALGGDNAFEHIAGWLA
jgi:cobalamin biosynthesis Mg chelatase CobN